MDTLVEEGGAVVGCGGLKVAAHKADREVVLAEESERGGVVSFVLLSSWIALLLRLLLLGLVGLASRLLGLRLALVSFLLGFLWLALAMS